MRHYIFLNALCIIYFIVKFYKCFSIESLKAQLPWQPGSAASVTIYVHGASDFLANDQPMMALDNSANLHSDDGGSLPSLSIGKNN